jgi:hypothetical protein
MFSDGATAQATEEESAEWMVEGNSLFKSAKRKLDLGHQALTFFAIETKIKDGIYRTCTEFKSAMVRYPGLEYLYAH